MQKLVKKKISRGAEILVVQTYHVARRFYNQLKIKLVGLLGHCKNYSHTFY